MTRAQFRAFCRDLRRAIEGESQTPKKPRLVLVEWGDSGQPEPQWQWLSDVHVAAAVRCQTAGFLIQDNKAVRVIAQNVGDLEGDARQLSDVIRISTRAVTRIATLKAYRGLFGRVGVGFGAGL